MASYCVCVYVLCEEIKPSKWDCCVVLDGDYNMDGWRCLMHTLFIVHRSTYSDSHLM